MWYNRTVSVCYFGKSGGNRMISFSDAWLNLVNVVKSFRPTDVLDILITSFLVYKLITWGKSYQNRPAGEGLTGAGYCIFFSGLDAVADDEVRDAVSIWQCPDFIGSYFSARTAYGAGEGWPQPDFQTGSVFSSRGEISGPAMENGDFGHLRGAPAPSVRKPAH